MLCNFLFDHLRRKGVPLWSSWFMEGLVFTYMGDGNFSVNAIGKMEIKMFFLISTGCEWDQNIHQRRRNFLCWKYTHLLFSFQPNKLNLNKLSINEVGCGQLSTIKLPIHKSYAQLKVVSVLSCQTISKNNTCAIFLFIFSVFEDKWIELFT